MPDNTDNIYNSDNFNLIDWNISVPIDSTGGTTGTAISISPLTNYESPYFYDNPDGSMTFYAPVTGATTSNSDGTRSELRELNPNGSLAAWTLATGGTMTATVAVNSVPTLLNGSAGKIMVGQIHAKSGELIRLYYDAGKIYFKDHTPTGSQHTYQLTDAAGAHPNIGLNQKFSYMIDAHGSTLTVKIYIGSDVYTSTTPIDSSFNTQTLYFKAGVYNGDAGFASTNLQQGTGAGKATFYGLDMSHTAGQGLGGLSANAPVAQADSFSGSQDHVITGNVLTNDTAPSGLTKSIAAATQTTAHGSVVENANGTFTYTPVAGFFGTDSFTYTLKDGSGLTATGMVNITVNGTAKPPVANSDSFTGTENHTVTGNVMTNDTDPNGLVLSVTAATMTTAHGSVVQNADGTFIYTPSTDFTGTDNFSYTLNDSAGLSATGTASITINAPAPTGPVVNGTNGADSLNADHTLGTIVNGLGGNDTIQGHDGNDTIYGGDGNDKLYGYWGNDVIYGGAGSDTLSGSYGSDTFTFKAADLGTGVDKISDFSTSAGDKINISDVLSGHFNPATDILTNFVNIVTSGSNSILEVDLSGHAGASGWAQVATISGVTNLDEQLLVHKGNLIV